MKLLYRTEVTDPAIVLFSHAFDPAKLYYLRGDNIVITTASHSLYIYPTIDDVELTGQFCVGLEGITAASYSNAVSDTLSGLLTIFTNPGGTHDPACTTFEAFISVKADGGATLTSRSCNSSTSAIAARGQCAVRKAGNTGLINGLKIFNLYEATQVIRGGVFELYEI